MKKIILSILSFLLLSAPAILAGSEQSTDSMTKKETTTKPKKEKAPKSDTEIQKCIMDKFSNSEKLRPQGFNVSVSNGEATLTGNAQNAGSKGAATRIAQSCGAMSVNNNITAPAIPRPKKSEPEKKG